MDLEGGKSISRAFEGVGPEMLTFLGPNGTRYARSHSGPKKVSISGPTPSNAPRYGLPPIRNPYVPPHINSSYINSYHTEHVAEQSVFFIVLKL